MMDIQLTQQDDFSLDINLANGEVLADDGLETAVLISIFTEALAGVDDELPGDIDSTLARRGWWGTEFLELESGTLGSRLWLNSREKVGNEGIERIRANTVNAVQWLIAEGIAQLIDVVVERQDGGTAEDVAISINVKRPDGNEINFRFSNLWQGVFN